MLPWAISLQVIAFADDALLTGMFASSCAQEWETGPTDLTFSSGRGRQSFSVGRGSATQLARRDRHVQPEDSRKLIRRSMIPEAEVPHWVEVM